MGSDQGLRSGLEDQRQRRKRGNRKKERKKGENVFINTSFLSGFCSFVQSNWGSKGTDAVGGNVYSAMHGHELKGFMCHWGRRLNLVGYSYIGKRNQFELS